MGYIKSIDGLKGIAIIMVVLYHMGLLKTGYLGVDIFLVINGFLIIPSLYNKVLSGEFSYGSFIIRRIGRLYPLISLACFVSLAIGYFCMLPDNLENLSESVVASEFLSTNILSYITTGNYWKVTNNYRPLMHLWYVGILFEFYLTIPLLFWLLKAKNSKTYKRNSLYALGLLAFCSLVLYVIPVISYNDKFYLIPYRYFEFVLGGIVGLYSIGVYNLHKNATPGIGGGKSYQNWIFATVFVIIVFIFLSGLIGTDFSNLGFHQTPIGALTPNANTLFILPKEVLLIIIVICTSILLYKKQSRIKILEVNLLTTIGKKSYSIFIWHQIILAFYRVAYSDEIDGCYLLFNTLLIVLISYLSYKYIESSVLSKRMKLWMGLSVISIIASTAIYLNAGVVRDVPELDIYKNNIHRNMHAEYCDRIYDYDKDFDNEVNKTKVLIVGNSYARDMGNILLESKKKDDVQISYRIEWDAEAIERSNHCDYLFFFGYRKELPKEIKVPYDRIYGIGTKSYGNCNDAIFLRRYSKDYYNITVPVDINYKNLNDEWIIDWGKEHYIDMLSMVLTEDNRVRIFTPNHKFISQDTKHLSKTGAEWYSKMIDFDKIFR